MHRLGVALIGIIAGLAGCTGPAAPATPPPAEPHTAFAPVEVKVDSDPDWLTAGFGSIWLKRPEGIVDRIDAATAKITAQIEADTTSPDHCNGIGRGTTGVWSCSFQDLVRIDPETDKVAETIPAGKIVGQGRIVGAAGRMWVLAGEGDRLVGVAEADGSLSDPITLPVACHDLGAAADIVYAACERANRVLRVDPATSTVTANVELTGPLHLSAAESGVWVAGAQDLVRLDPATLATSLTVKGVSTGSLGSIWADVTGVWVRGVGRFLTRVDAQSGAQARVIDAPFDSGGDVLVDGAYLWASDFDERVVLRLEIPTGS